MKIGEIKIEAIKLMHINDVADLSVDDLPDIEKDTNYRSYLVNMDGTINRALDRIQNACVLPLKTKSVLADEVAESKFFIRYDLSQIEDLYLLERVVGEDGKGRYFGNVEYKTEGNTIVLDKGLEYTLLYYPKLKPIDNNVTDNDDIWLPDYIARLIPYFIKGELYQEDEASLAAEARNLFEKSLEDLKLTTQSKQNAVKRVYGY